MEWLNKPRTWVVLGACAVGLVLLQQLWKWEVERVEVPPDHFLVKVNLWGHDLPEGEIVAPDDTFKGVQRRLLKEGRHFLNPLWYTYERHAVLVVPNDSCAVLIRKAGPEISPARRGAGEFLAAGAFDPEAESGVGERGILREVLRPGKYYINPHEYAHEIHKATRIDANQVGVRVLKWGRSPSQLTAEERHRYGPYVVPEGFRGVQKTFLRQGVYYVNPYVEAIVPVDISTHEVEFTDIVFPSKDGFQIQPHVKVTYKVMEEMAPELYVMLCDHGVLEQGDRTPELQKKNPILQKFVLPMIRGTVRIEGSKHEARDFVSQQRNEGPLGAATALSVLHAPLNALAFAALLREPSVNPREKLQEALTAKERLEEWARVGVRIESITVGQLAMNADLKKLAEQIAQRETTRVERDKNLKLVEQYKQEQELKAKEALAEQRKHVVKANQGLKVETTRAKQAKETETAKLENELKAAQARLDAAEKQARAIRTRAQGEADVILAQNKAEVAGLERAVAGFPSPEHFAQYHVLTRLAPALSEIFASDQSEFARVFSTYMTPGRRLNGGTPGNGRAAGVEAKKP